MDDTLPRRARAVVIGGGIVGCSIAYHLAALGWRDIVLLERRQLTCGTTWHAAGLVGQLRQTLNLTRMARYATELYGRLEAETGQATGFRQTGSLSVATTRERLEELKRAASMARIFGLEVQVLTPAECLARHPLLDGHGLEGGVFLPGDGQTDPTGTTLALAKGARARGVRIVEQVKVTGIRRHAGRVAGVETQRGGIDAEVVVNCGGLWAREIGRMAGANVPLHACEHFYAVTEPIPTLPRGLPTLRVPDEALYVKEDAGKLLFGGFEPQAKPWGEAGIPEDFCFDQLPEDLDHFAPILNAALARVPVLAGTGIRTFFNGPESFTPDGRYLLGETPELPGFFVACGFNSVGIQSAAGAGRALAEWIEGGAAPFDLWDVDIRRMQPFQGTRVFLRQRVSETLGLLYADHFPHRQFATARGIRRSPLHAHLAARGACFGEAAGWERANWFAAPGEAPEYRYGWGRQNWFPHAAAEHTAVRTGVGLFDLTSLAKFRIEGPDAEDVLQRICAADIAVPVGRIVCTPWLNEQGGVEADVSVARLGEEAFLVATAAACAVRDRDWLRRHIPPEARCAVFDATSAEAVLAVVGPGSRALLQDVTDADLSNAAFPLGTLQPAAIGAVPARAHRISCVGELGWELYVPSEMAPCALEAILEAGGGHGLRLCGMHALDSCRMEKAYRHYGHDVSGEDHVLEAGLAVDVDKPRSRFGAFIGRDAVRARRESGLTRRLLQFRLRDSDPLLLGNEPIWHGGAIVGRTTSGAYGHHLGAAVALGYVSVADEHYEIEIAGQRHAAIAAARPMYDPENLRMRM